jgi:hypothetical protein
VTTKQSQPEYNLPTYFKKSPLVGLKITAACACAALTNGYGKLRRNKTEEANIMSIMKN